MVLRDEFQRLGVPDHMLAQVIWAEMEDRDYTPADLIALARRLFPDGIHAMIEGQFGQANAPIPLRLSPQALQNAGLRLRRSG